MTTIKPKIFIAAHYLEIGGAEISLIGLLQSIDYNRYNVDLFLYRHTGELIALIPKEVNLLPEIPAYTQFECPLKHSGNIISFQKPMNVQMVMLTFNF